MAKWIVLALVALTALKDAATDSPRQCSKGCGTAPQHDFKFNVQPGHTYVYNFEATTETSVPGAAVTGEDENAGGHKAPGGQRLHITGQAELHAGANCDHVMQLLHVQVTGADGKKFQDFASCERHPLGFSWNNGRLGTDVCVEDGDTPVDVNVKRAILSLMQVSKVQPSGSASLHETDIFGVCPTDFTYHEEGDVLKVTKRRNLNRCAHREGLHNNFFSSYYDEPSELHSSPLLQSTLQVEQTIKDKMVVSAVGEESYLFRPFSNGASGAQTTVTTRLTLVKHQPGPAPPVTNGHGSSILFDAHKWNLGGANPEDQATVEHVTHALKAAEKSLVGGASTESAGAFRSLTRVMRYANAECLMNVYSQVKAGTGFTSKKLAKAVFLDALLQTGTGQSIEAVVQLINAKDLSPEVSKLYYLGFSFIRHATRGSLKAVASLLESPSLPPEAYLGAGALVGRYCSEHQCDDTIPEFKVLVGKLAHKLGKGCKPVNREHENEIVGALKGLQNAKKLTAEAADAIMKCAVNDVPTRVRVAALDAFLGDPCQQKLKKTALEMMKNRDLDSELRIKAYLAVTECPCEAVANAVKEMMEDEPIHQVGSFVTSHLFTLRTSSNPDKAQAKHYLGGIRPKKRYPFDPTKFSRAYESSYSMDGLNLATSAEGNVIFSQKSFVPRSASLNLTTSLFGHNFNLFEVGVRAENVDFLLESLLGPRGYFKTHKPKEIMDEVKHDFEEAMEHIEKRAKQTRGKRVARHVTREMVDALGKKVGHSVDHDDHSLDVDIHMKLFGSEVGWANYHGTLPKMSFKSGIDKFFDHVDDGINKAKDFKLDVSPNLAIFDSQLVYPTGAGFSLILDASAYSSVDLKVESQVDVPAMMRNPGNSKFHMKLLPSASVEVSGAMFVDAFANVMAGLEVVGNVHSSTGFGLDVQALENGNGVEVKFGVPKPKQEVFSFHSQVMSVRREKGHAPVHAPVKFNKGSTSYHGCFEQLTPLTGLVFCGDVKFPWDGLSSAVVPKPNQALFPLDGPAKLSFHIEKENEALTHYYFRALLSDKGPHKKHFEMKFDTPNSKVDRAVQLDLEVEGEPDKVVKVDVKTPWIKFILEGAAVSNENEHSLMGKYVSEGSEYKAKLGLALKSASGNKREYTPTLEVSTPEKKKVGKGPKRGKAGTKNFGIEGTITIEDDNAAHKHVFTFNGVKLVTNKAKYGLEGSVGRDDEHSFSSDLKLKYDDLKHYFALKGKVYELTKSMREYDLKVDAEFTASQFQEVGFHVKLDSQVKPEHVENTFDLIHGPDLKSEMAHLHISNIYVFKHESDSNYHVSVNNRVTYPLAGLEGKLMGEVKPGHVQYEIDAKYDKHQVDSALDFKYGKTPEEGYDFKWGVVAFGTGFQLDSKRVVSSPKNSKVDVCLELKPSGRKYVLESDLTHSYVGGKQFDFRANSVLKIPGYQHYRLDGGAAMDTNTFKTHLEAHEGKVCHVNLRAHGELDSDGQCKSAEWSSLLLNHLQGSGHYSSDSKGTKGDFLVHLIKSDRKLKGDFSNVHSEDGTCKTLANFFWDAEKDPSKKLHFESVNHVQPLSVDSKNKLVILGETTQVDVKISAQGKMTVGSGIFDVDIHLPSGRYLYLKSQTKMNMRPSSEGDSDGEAHVTMCDKHSGGESCLKVHEVLSNYNLEKGSYVCSSDSTYLRHDGKELKFGAELKILPKDEKTEMSGKAYVSGSLLGQVKPMSVEWGGEAVNGDYSYHALGKLGEDQSLGVKGKLDSSGDGGNTKVGEFHIDAHTNVENLKHVSFGQVAKVTHVSADVYDFTSSSDLKWGSDKKLTLGAKVHKDNHKGSASVTMCLPGDTEDHVVMVEWSDEAVNPKVEGSVAFMWPQGKKMKFEMQAATPKDSLSLHLTAHTPVKGHEKMELILNHKNLKALYAMETDVTLVASPEHKFSVHSRVEYPQNKRVVDLSVTREGGPTNKVHARLEKKGDNHFESELKADWEGQSLTAESSLKYSGVDDFALHGFLDSTALKVKKWSIDIATKEGGAKGGKAGKRVVFSGKKAGEVVFQGSTSFSSKQEANAITYEGVGQLKMGDETRNANFKLFTKMLSAKEGGENGFETKMTLGISSNKGDKHNVVGEAKLTSSEVRFFNSYCKGGSECSSVEAFSKVKFEDLQHDMEHEFKFIVDLEKLFHVVPVSVIGNTHHSEHGLDHKVEAQVNKGKSKYSYHLYAKKEEAGAVLVLPKRTLAVVATLEAKPNVGEYAQIHSGVSVWLDKERHPELKTSGSFDVLTKVKVPELAIKTEAKLSHPSLGRDLAIRGELECSATNIEFDSKLEFDVFAEEDQKVVVSAKLDKVMQENGGNLTAMVDFKSKGQKIDAEWVTYGFYAERSLGLGSFFTYVNHNNEHRDTGAVFRVNPKSLFLLVKADSHEVLKADLKADISEAKQVLVSEIGVLGKHTHVDTYEFRGVNSFKYSSHEKGSPDDQIEAHGTLVWGKAFEVHADRLKGGQKEVLAHLFVNLNKENFFDVKHTWEQDHVKQYVSDVMNDYKFMGEEAKKMADEMGASLQADGKHFLELLKKASPNVKPLLESYQKQLTEMKDEILNDEYIHEVVVALEKAVHALQEAFAQTIEKLRHMNEEFEKVWHQYWEKVIAFYEKMAPAVRESVGKVVAAVCEGFEKFSHYVVEALEKVFGFMQQFSGEFKAVGKVIVQFIQDVARTVGKLLDETKHHFEEWKQMAAEHLQAVPAFEMVKQYYDGFMANLPDYVDGVITEVMATLKESAPTMDLKDFLNALENYLKKKLHQAETDDQAELKNLYNLFVKAIKSLEDFARSQGHDYPKDFSLSQLKFPFWSFGSGPKQSLFTLDDIARLPFFFAVRASPFFYKVDDFPTPKELFSEFVPALLKGQLPPQEAHAFLVGGEHFFTFDNRHYTLSGCACDYVLAQDFEDGNFSIVGHYEGGKLMSITLVDPKDMFELSMDLTLKVNGQPSEFPVRHNTMSAWSEFDVVSMKTAYGAKVTCDRRFKDVCMVSINGYYFGKTRGLLGTLNNEPYDDYVMPSGKVAPTVDKLANSWKADASCGDVAAQTHVHEHAKQCSDMFAGYSPMRVCFPVVDPAPFREACDADIAMRSGDACKFSAAYAAACYFNGVKVRVPDQCAQCKVGGNSVQHGFSVSLKAPQGKADIVLAVEQAPQNEVLFKDLLVPLVASITNDLKAHKITDVKFILIGYGEHNNPWPNIFTTNGQVGFDGKGENVHFPAHTPEDKLVLDGLHPDVEKFVQMVDRLNKLVKVEFARLPYADAFYLAREYPFRPGAAKAVISLMHSRCLYSPLPVSTQSVRLFLQKKQYEMSGVAFHVLSPITFTSASRDRKQIRQVVGLDKNGVFSLGDAKKKVLDGDVEFKKDLSYDADVCVDFAQATNGGAYSTRNFAGLPKPGFKKLFTNVVSKRVVQSLSPEFTEECTCQLYHGWHPVTRCRVTSRKESARLTTKSAELELRIPALGLSVIIGGINSESVE
ncbi:apolipophorins-like isoform X2 [Ischnura elegans]|uniref:apolipophorins-like isoform X2 n=1 Tax=Ischnura elegans TaxID=197161 RepID=UPI001ED89E4D|nr:apolipophorins-like isoform X2 [Ischnura elegans]